MSGSHLCVFGTSVWCMFQVERIAGIRFVYVSYITLCCYSLIGVMRYGSPRYGSNIDNIYETSDVAVQCFVLPGLVTDLFHIYGYEWIIGTVNYSLAIIPFSMFLFGTKDQGLIDLFILVNTVSLLALSTINENTCGIFSVITYFLTHFLMPDTSGDDPEDIPRKFAYNIWMSWFCYFSYRTIADALGLGLEEGGRFSFAMTYQMNL